MNTTTTRRVRGPLVRWMTVTLAAGALMILGGAAASAQDTGPEKPPATLKDLTAEQKGWRDAEGAISCTEHPDFLPCTLTSGTAVKFNILYPDDNTQFRAVPDLDASEPSAVENSGGGGGLGIPNVVDAVASVPGKLMGKAVDSAFGKAAESIGIFAGDFLVDSMVWWLKTDSIDVSYGNALTGKEPIQKLIGFVMMAGILTSAIIMMITRRTQPAAEILMAGVKYILISSLALIVLKGALAAGDDLTRQLVEDGAQEFGPRVKAMLGTAVIGNPGGVLFLGLVAASLSFIQWVMGFVRQAGIVVLYSLILIAAAGQFSSWGRQWFPRIAGACIALVLFKPIAAMIYMIGFKLIGTEQSLTTLVTGIMVIALAVVALPSMMKFFSFLGMQVGGGMGAGAVLAGAVAAGAGGAMLASGMGGGDAGSGDAHSSFMAATGPDGSSEPDPSPGNGPQGLGGGGSLQGLPPGGGNTPESPTDSSGVDGPDPTSDPSSASENPDASGVTPTDPGSTGPDLGDASAAGQAGGAGATAAAGAATGGIGLAAAAGAKALGGAADAADGVASEMAPDTGPDMK